MENRVRPLMILLLLVGMFPAALMADPTWGRSYARNNLGIRLGWVGAPNGISFRRTYGNGHAFEVLAGYSYKYARHTELPEIKKGNSFVGISYQPHLTIGEGNLAVGIYGDLGVRLNYHHYRYFSDRSSGPKVTPDLTGGVGMLVEFSETVEVFGDMHVKYYSNPGNFYAPGVESGLGIRFALN